jgi:hypothetical protein
MTELNDASIADLRRILDDLNEVARNQDVPLIAGQQRLLNAVIRRWAEVRDGVAPDYRPIIDDRIALAKSYAVRGGGPNNG